MTRMSSILPEIAVVLNCEYMVGAPFKMYNIIMYGTVGPASVLLYFVARLFLVFSVFEQVDVEIGLTGAGAYGIIYGKLYRAVSIN